MTCKNCKAALRTDYVFCPACGAKVAPNRLTYRGLFADILERFFDWDNSFHRTVRTMTVHPEKVIGDYIDGVRRRYLNPMSYLGIALGLSGILLFAMKYSIHEIDFDFLGMGTSSAASTKILDATMEYNSFIFLLYIPLLAIAGILSFNKRDYNLPEHVVSATYSLAHFSILTFPISMLILFLVPEDYLKYSLIYIVFMIGYSLFVLIRLHRYGLGITLIRSMLYTVLVIIGYFGLSLLINLIMLLTGVVTLEDFLPKP
ncbi:DUF3667 domain-containing protein [Robiginitalea aurantiaca]|uniref:DUF3667 domain-containing protein n=1 Tax=Robiginitalea aurantiaca TaxID=3056915 RepID=A0ABT7WDE0_9FLAO|nr:DUF3667 domain-containing protein [Robiginitalea aurantiaca]MDM9630935.1 DUF3667 domain-containing protein [Robiginitalea aurantiaca]